ALKYGQGKPVEVRVSGEPGLPARLEVQDHGIGIPASDRERIFERFERAVPTRNFGGLGLGLYIVRQIVQAHGGRIELASEDGDGTTFAVTLPPAAPEQDAPADARNAAE